MARRRLSIDDMDRSHFVKFGGMREPMAAADELSPLAHAHIRTTTTWGKITSRRNESQWLELLSWKTGLTVRQLQAARRKGLL